MNTKEHENTQYDTSTKQPVDAKLEAEIDEAIRVSFEGKKMNEEENKEVGNTDEGGTDKPDVVVVDSADDSKIDDTTVERAVKAGMTISSAKLFADKTSLLEVVSLLEGKTSKKEDSKPSDSGGVDPEDEISIPDLENEDEYDPALIAGYKAMKAAILKQSETIKTLKAGGGSPGGKDWFESKVGALGEAFKDSLGVGVTSPKPDQVEARNKVKIKFDVLSAGYKQAKLEVSTDEVFSEALKMVVGDVAEVASDAAKAKALAARNSKLQIQRPSPVDGKTGKQSVDDIRRDIADEIDAKFFKR